jgi:GNAT superfamily N-acetyltransferase
MKQVQEQDLELELDRSPAPEDTQVVWNGLRQHNDEYVPATGDVTFAVFLRGTKGTILGGVLAKAGRGWLHLNTLWVDPSVRGQGYGVKLVAAAEAEARQLGCHSAYLDTFSYQARPFYERCGYEVFGTLDDYPQGHQRFFMRKSLK